MTECLLLLQVFYKYKAMLLILHYISKPVFILCQPWLEALKHNQEVDFHSGNLYSYQQSDFSPTSSVTANLNTAPSEYNSFKSTNCSMLNSY